MDKSMRRGVGDGDDISTTKLMGIDLAPLEIGSYARRRSAPDTKRDGLLLLVTTLANEEERLML